MSEDSAERAVPEPPVPSGWAVPGSVPGGAPQPSSGPPPYQAPPPAQIAPGQILPPHAVQPGYGSNGQPSYGGPAYSAPGYAPPPGYGPPAGYGPPPSYPVSPGYPASGYPVSPGYPPSPGYGPPGGFGAASAGPPGYGPPAGYGPAGPPRFGGPPRPAPANSTAIRVDAIEGTNFGVAYPAIPPTPSGPAITSMVAGIGSILVAFAVGCFGISGADGGWGPTVSGAFALLSAFVGAGAIFIGVRALRNIRESRGMISGRGLAIAGISCGGSGAGLTVLFFLLALLAVL